MKQLKIKTDNAQYSKLEQLLKTKTKPTVPISKLWRQTGLTLQEQTDLINKAKIEFYTIRNNRFPYDVSSSTAIISTNYLFYNLDEIKISNRKDETIRSLSNVNNFSLLIDVNDTFGTFPHMMATFKEFIKKIVFNYTEPLYILVPIYNQTVLFSSGKKYLCQFGITGSQKIRENIQESMRREVAEEIGVDITNANYKLVYKFNNYPKSYTGFCIDINTCKFELQDDQTSKHKVDDKNNKVCCIVYGTKNDIINYIIKSKGLRYRFRELGSNDDLNIIGTAAIPITLDLMNWIDNYY